MIQKIQGEQPFQILSDAFSIGPSNTGYELQISADGSHFSTLFTVGANTTRLVSNVANGSFYRLKNNVGEVAVNWRTTCKGGGSGGSGSTVSVNQILSAGTEIAQISVDGVPTSLYAPEGGEGATAYYFKDMERSELAELYTLLETEAGRPDTEGVLSASTINEKYTFYGNFGKGRENIPLVFWGFYFGRAVFVNTLSKQDTADGIANYMIWLQSDGTFEQQRERDFNFPKDFEFLKNYLQGGKTFPFRYDKGTGVFSVKNDVGQYETLSSANTYGFDSSIYWFALSDADWADGIAELPFQIISGETVLDSYSFPTVRREAINETIDEVTYTQKWYFDYGDFVFSLITNGDLTTRGFEYTEAAAGGGDGLVHLETLSGVTGETNVMYECDGELFWWNPSSGYSAEWDGLPTSGLPDNVSGFSFVLNYTEIPDGTVIAEYSYVNPGNRSRIIKNGDKLEVRYEADNYETVRQSGVTGETITGLTSNGGSSKIIIVFNSYSIIFRSDNSLYFSSFWDGSANTAHWEMATKPENEPFTAQQDGVPIWDKSGKIIGKGFNVLRGITYINSGRYGNPAYILYSNAGRLPEHMFFPTSGGTAGQVLTSAGDAEPVWATMIKAVQITSADYEALATKDANTLYLIVDE